MQRHPRRTGSLFVLALVVASAHLLPQKAESQSLKELAAKAKQALDQKKLDQLLKTAIKCKFVDNACVLAAKAAKKPVVLTDEKGKVLIDDKGQPVTEVKQLPPEQQAVVAETNAAAASTTAQKAVAAPAQTQGAPSAGPPITFVEHTPRPLNVRRLVIPPADRTWERDPVVQKVKGHYVLGLDLYSAATDQVAVKDYASAGTWLVAGRADLFVSLRPNPALPGFSGPVMLHRAGTRLPLILQDGCSGSSCTVEEFDGLPGPTTAIDARRAIYFDGGDLWRAEVDWINAKLINSRRVTAAGVLDRAGARGYPEPIHWYGNTLLMRANHPEKPILRIDLSSGKIEELTNMLVFDGSMFTNPAGYRVCRSYLELLACYDARSRTVSRLSMLDVVTNGEPFVNVVALAGNNPPTAARTVWVDDETLVSAEVVNLPGVITRLDFRGWVAERLFEARPSEQVRGMSLLPDGRHLAVSLMMFKPGDRSVRNVRVSIEDGTVIDLPADLPADGKWLDLNQYLYYKQSGGISEIGTWIYDVTSKASRRICTASAVPNSVVYFAEYSKLYFYFGGSNTGMDIYRANLKDGACGKIATAHPQTGGIWVPRTPPLDLKLSLSGDALWQAFAGASAPAASQKAAATEPGPEGLEKVLQAIDNLPPLRQTEIISVYNQTNNLADYYDRTCVTLKYNDWRKSSTQAADNQTFSQWWQRGEALGCRDRERIAHWAYNQAKPFLKSGKPRSEEEIAKISACVGQTFADQAMTLTIIQMANVRALLNPAMQKCNAL